MQTAVPFQSMCYIWTYHQAIIVVTSFMKVCNPFFCLVKNELKDHLDLQMMHPPTGKYLISRQQWHPADTNGSHKASESIKTPVFDGDKLHIPPYHHRRIHCLYWIRPKPGHRERIHTRMTDGRSDGWMAGWMSGQEWKSVCFDKSC